MAEDGGDNKGLQMTNRIKKIDQTFRLRTPQHTPLFWVQGPVSRKSQ